MYELKKIPSTNYELVRMYELTAKTPATNYESIRMYELKKIPSTNYEFVRIESKNPTHELRINTNIRIEER